MLFRHWQVQSLPIDGGVTASTEWFAAKRHAGVWSPVIDCKMIVANTELAYAA